MLATEVHRWLISDCNGDGSAAVQSIAQSSGMSAFVRKTSTSPLFNFDLVKTREYILTSLQLFMVKLLDY